MNAPFPQQNQSTITMGDKVYGYGKLPALTQFHVVRRCLPVMAPVIGTVMSLVKEQDKVARMKILLDNVGPFSKTLAEMKDEEANYVIRECLKVCTSIHGGAHMPVSTADGTLTDTTISMPTMIRLTMAVVDQHLGDFFGLLIGATA